jgi:hypothetical protein
VSIKNASGLSKYRDETQEAKIHPCSGEGLADTAVIPTVGFNGMSLL